MRHYVFVANDQVDNSFQYADFGVEHGLSIAFLKFNRMRIGVLRVLDKLHIKSTFIVRKLILNPIFKSEIVPNVKDDEGNGYVFIIMARVYEKYGSGITDFLRKKYPDVRLIMYFDDLLHRMRFDVEKSYKFFDMVCSFDELEAKKNGLRFVLEPFSAKRLAELNDIENPEYDVTFIGTAKNRYELIISIFEACKEHGLKCDFYINKIEEGGKPIHEKDIHFNTWVDFIDVLNHVKNAKCAIEVMQQGAYSGTTRYAEAMILERNLLTNSLALKEPENQENNIFYFENIDDIPFDEIVKVHRFDVEKYIRKFSIAEYVRKMNQHLEDVLKEKN